MIDLLSPCSLANPYPILNKIREEKPLCEIKSQNAWILSRFDDVKSGLANHALFSSSRKLEQFIPTWLNKELRPDFFLPCIDPPGYAARRSILNPPFARKKIHSLQPLMAETANKLVTSIQHKDSIEFLEDFSYPYISEILGHITGLNTLQPLKETREWIKALELSAIQNVNKKTRKKIHSIISRQHALFNQAVKDRRNNPVGDLICEWMHADIDGEKLTTNQLINIIELMIRAGFQTTVHVLAISVIQLIHRPDILTQLLLSPQLIPAFVGELLRLHSSVPVAVRHITEDTAFYGKTLYKGSKVWLCLAAANRDPRVFSNPDEYDLSRPAKSSLISFGLGPHNCLGQHLGRLEIEVALAHLINIIGTMSCPDERDLKWIKTLDFRGLKELPITYQ